MASKVEIQDEIKRSCVALSALRQNAPDTMDAKYVAVYHTELDRLAALGVSVDEWRIPDDWLTKRLLMAWGDREA